MQVGRYPTPYHVRCAATKATASTTASTAATDVAASSNEASGGICDTRALAKATAWWTRQGETGVRTAGSRNALRLI